MSQEFQMKSSESFNMRWGLTNRSGFSPRVGCAWKHPIRIAVPLLKLNYNLNFKNS